MSDGSTSVFQAASAAQLMQIQSEGVLGLDADFRITFVNRAAQYLLGYAEDELIGRGIHASLQPKKRDGSAYPEDESPLAWLKAGAEVYFVEDVFWRKNGTACDFEISALMLPEADGPTQALVLLRDVSDIKKVQEALIQAFVDRDALNRSLETAQEKMLQSEKLAAELTREISASINFVTASLDVLKSDIEDSRNDLDVSRKELCSAVDESIETLRRIGRIINKFKSREPTERTVEQSTG